MAYKQGHESLETYTDGLKVKISERYKPPPRISPAMTYSQRLTLNKQTQDNIPTYEFSLEKPVLDKVREWKAVRIEDREDRQSRVEKAREKMIKKREQEEHEQLEETEVKTVNETVAVTNNNNFVDNTTLPYTTNVSTGTSYYNYATDNSILVPTQALKNYSTILTPIPLQSYGNQQFGGKKDDKSPFNISDFENDTSSPFDNMELKSINDMEELAQVLNKGERVQKDENATTYPIYQNVMVQPQASYSNYPGNHQYSSYIPNSSSYVAPTNTNYSYTNGYYYSPDMMQPNQSFNNPYDYSKTNLTNYTYANPFQESSQLETTKNSTCKSVPDIITALESELENMQVSNKNEASFIRSSCSSQAVRPKSTDGVCTDPNKKKVEESDNPFDTLNKDDQDLCRSISSMGFPIARVARVCKLLGNDQKKIVDHLLALSDLLDLGFTEKKVSDALLQCDNDRDKALDKLIL